MVGRPNRIDGSDFPRNCNSIRAECCRVVITTKFPKLYSKLLIMKLPVYKAFERDPRPERDVFLQILWTWSRSQLNGTGLWSNRSKTQSVSSGVPPTETLSWYLLNIELMPQFNFDLLIVSQRNSLGHSFCFWSVVSYGSLLESWKKAVIMLLNYNKQSFQHTEHDTESIKYSSCLVQKSHSCRSAGSSKLQEHKLDVCPGRASQDIQGQFH